MLEDAMQKEECKPYRCDDQAVPNQAFKVVGDSSGHGTPP
jgi:hypothetical protein